MPVLKKKVVTLNLKDNLKDKYVAFIDVMGFSNLVFGSRVENLESYFGRISEVLDELKEEKADIESLLISDSIILIAPDSKASLNRLITAIRKIQSALLWKKILLRGAVTFGQVYYNADRNIIVGKGFIKAYHLESEAVYPRVIIDPSIINKFGITRNEFLEEINGTSAYNFERRKLYAYQDNSRISDDAIFIDYANKTIKEVSVNGNLRKVYETIAENLYGEQKLFTKYIWLKNYFLDCFTITIKFLQEDNNTSLRHLKIIEDWRDKFSKL